MWRKITQYELNNSLKEWKKFYTKSDIYFKKELGDWKDRTVGRVFASHTADLCLNPGTL